MRCTTLFAALGLFGIMGLAGARAGEITVDDTTGCDWTVRSFDSHDMPAVKAISDYIGATMRDHEREVGGRMLQRLSSSGYNNMMAVPVGLCDQHRDRSLHDAILETYDGFAAIQKSVGIQ